MIATPIVNHHCHLGEGPLWHPEEKVLYWTDIEAGDLYRYDPGTGESGICLRGDKLGGMTLQVDGSLLLFMNKGGIRLWRDEKLIDIHVDIPDERETRFNDVIADPRGRVFCGLMGTPSREGHLYLLGTDHSLTLVLDEVGCSNGIGFPSNGKQMYFTDSNRAIFLYDYDAETGEIANRREFYRSPITGVVPDGMTVDAEDHVWTAQWGGSCVIRLRPDGTEADRIEVPEAKFVTSVAFGGDGLSDLYITTAKQDDSGENAGAVFMVRPGVGGVPEFRSAVRV